MGDVNWPDCLVKTPLKDFKPGQKLMFRRFLKGYSFTMGGEFIKIDRGLVVFKPVPPWSPEYFRQVDIERMFPNGIARVRASSCFLWGNTDPAAKPCYRRCHWFKDTKTPAV